MAIQSIRRLFPRLFSFPRFKPLITVPSLADAEAFAHQYVQKTGRNVGILAVEGGFTVSEVRHV